MYSDHKWAWLSEDVKSSWQNVSDSQGHIRPFLFCLNADVLLYNKGDSFLVNAVINIHSQLFKEPTNLY